MKKNVQIENSCFHSPLAHDVKFHCKWTARVFGFTRQKYLGMWHQRNLKAATSNDHIFLFMPYNEKETGPLHKHILVDQTTYFLSRCAIMHCGALFIGPLYWQISQ